LENSTFRDSSAQCLVRDKVFILQILQRNTIGRNSDKVVGTFWQRYGSVNTAREDLFINSSCPAWYTQGDSDVISMPAGFRRYFVGKTLRNVFHCDRADIRFVGKLVIIQTFS